MPVHFLESMDSVRSSVDPESNPGLVSPAQEEAAAQAHIEALLVLAFGRDIVVPQSYALDSYACQAVVSTVADAEQVLWPSRGERRARRRSVRLHLHGVTTFVEAAHDTFVRIATSDTNTFTSSLFPDLQATASAELIANEMRAGATANPLRGVTGDRGELFEGVWDYFKLATRDDPRYVEAPRPKPGPGLDQRVRAVADARREESGTLGRIARGIDVLAHASGQSHPFNNRSLLRSPLPWDADRSDESAAEILRDPELLDLLIEVVDTLYNRVVVQSIGDISASYVTQSMADSGETAAAQDLALSGDASDYPAFELAVDRSDLNDVGLVDTGRSLRAFTAVLSARESDRWTKSLNRLGEADGDRAQRRALERHVRLLADALGGAADVDLDHALSLKLRLAKTVAGGASGVGAGQVVDVAAAWNPLAAIALGAAGGVGVAALGDARSGLVKRRATKNLRRALGRVVVPR